MPASTPFSSTTATFTMNSNIQLADTVVKKKVVKKKKKGNVTTKTTVWRYDSSRHKRARVKDTTYVYYHDGYYYDQPYWTLAVPGVNLCIGC